jgi:RNA polymerase sigma-70 factor (ECF subfamily)
MIEPDKPIADPAEFERHRPALVRFSMLQVRNKDTAEDLVQETLLAALTARDGFSGKSSVRTWLTGILRHKIIDHIRKTGREVSVDALMDDRGADAIDAMFRDDGHYVQMPVEWGNPEGVLSERRFFEALERCVNGLPIVTSQVFLMRELMGCETAEICKELEISTTNCWVLLHRARMRLRACLEERWFAGGQK